MDYKDFIDGQSENSFYFKCKKELVDILLERVENKNLKILDIGAGTGGDLDVLNKYGEIYAIDTNKSALNLIPDDRIKEKKICNATNLTYPDNFFDIVCSFDVFEHISNDYKAVSEVFRVLKKDGFLILIVPAFNILYSSHDKALSHYRRYNKKFLLRLLKNFKDVKLFYWNCFLFLPLSIMRILKKKSQPKTDYFILPKLIEILFIKLLRIENQIIRKKINLPIGLSLVGYVKK